MSDREDMSGQEIEAPPARYSRSRSRRKPMIDLNAELLDFGVEGTSREQGPALSTQLALVPAPPPTPIDLEAVDDDVIISSPRAFEQAKNNSRAHRGRPIVVDVEAGDWVIPKNHKRRRTGPTQTFINYDQFINLEGSSSSKIIVPALPPPPPPPPKEPLFSCPVCMGPLVNETSTRCGHIFCRECIRAAITAQNKCPTCRRKTLMKDLIRVYLPSTS